MTVYKYFLIVLLVLTITGCSGFCTTKYIIKEKFVTTDIPKEYFKKEPLPEWNPKNPDMPMQSEVRPFVGKLHKDLEKCHGRLDSIENHMLDFSKEVERLNNKNGSD